MTSIYVTTTEAASIIGVSVRRVQAYCREGRLGAMLGGRYLINRRQAESFTAADAGRPAKPSGKSAK